MAEVLEVPIHGRSPADASTRPRPTLANLEPTTRRLPTFIRGLTRFALVDSHVIVTSVSILRDGPDVLLL